MKRYTPIILAIPMVLGLNSCEKICNGLRAGKEASISIDVAEGGSTRGSLISKTTMQTSPFVVNAFLESDGRSTSDNSNPHYLNNVDFSYSSGSWTSADATWRHKVQTNFWCHYPKTLASGHGTRTMTFASGKDMTDSQQKTVTVSYTMPSPGGSGTDATLTDDLLFAYATKMYDDEALQRDPSLKVEFSHILSAIMFTKGTVLDGYDIKSISLVNVLSSATCTLTGSGEGTLGISWNSQSTPETYTQNAISSDWTSSAFTTGDKVFWVIPQTPSDTTAIHVVFTKDSEEIPVDVLFGTATAWDAGKKYTYQISFNGINAVTSLTTGSVNYYSQKQGEWDETTNGLEDYHNGNGKWGTQTTVEVPALSQTPDTWD